LKKNEEKLKQFEAEREAKKLEKLQQQKFKDEEIKNALLLKDQVIQEKTTKVAT